MIKCSSSFRAAGSVLARVPDDHLEFQTSDRAPEFANHPTDSTSSRSAEPPSGQALLLADRLQSKLDLPRNRGRRRHQADARNGPVGSKMAWQQPELLTGLCSPASGLCGYARLWRGLLQAATGASLERRCIMPPPFRRGR
jgi:hypothetical protein